ncbi:alpha/beta fold hydrolase [Planctomycetota bacterium]|nr:alpha/beta fold hydrolase [Planctomycetota bacterium]
MKQVYFEESFRGQTIRGMQYQPDDDRPHPCVMLLHGFTGNRIECGMMFVQLARTLAEAGYMTVTFDFRFSGESDGSFENMLVSEELADAEHIAKYLRNLDCVDGERFGVIGFSLGGFVSACLMSKIDFAKTLVMISATTYDNMKRKWNDGILRKAAGPLRLNPEFYPDLEKLKSIEWVACNPRPTRLIHGTADEAVPAEGNSDRYEKSMKDAGVPVERILIDGATHGWDEIEHREMLLKLVKEHIKATL